MLSTFPYRGGWVVEKVVYKWREKVPKSLLVLRKRIYHKKKMYTTKMDGVVLSFFLSNFLSTVAFVGQRSHSACQWMTKQKQVGLVVHRIYLSCAFVFTNILYMSPTWICGKIMASKIWFCQILRENLLKLSDWNDRF